MFPASEGTPNPVPAGSETQKLLDELGGLKNDLVGAPEAGAPAQGGVPLPAETMTAREDVLPDWMRYPAGEVPDTGKQVIEGIAVAAPTLDVEPPEAPVAPGGDGGDGGEPPEAGAAHAEAVPAVETPRVGIPEPLTRENLRKRPLFRGARELVGKAFAPKEAKTVEPLTSDELARRNEAVKVRARKMRDKINELGARGNAFGERVAQQAVQVVAEAAVKDKGALGDFLGDWAQKRLAEAPAATPEAEAAADEAAFAAGRETARAAAETKAARERYKEEERQRRIQRQGAASGEQLRQRAEQTQERAGAADEWIPASKAPETPGVVSEAGEFEVSEEELWPEEALLEKVGQEAEERKQRYEKIKAETLENNQVELLVRGVVGMDADGQRSAAGMIEDAAQVITNELAAAQQKELAVREGINQARELMAQKETELQQQRAVKMAELQRNAEDRLQLPGMRQEVTRVTASLQDATGELDRLLSLPARLQKTYAAEIAKLRAEKAGFTAKKNGLNRTVTQLEAKAAKFVEAQTPEVETWHQTQLLQAGKEVKTFVDQQEGYDRADVEAWARMELDTTVHEAGVALDNLERWQKLATDPEGIVQQIAEVQAQQDMAVDGVEARISGLNGDVDKFTKNLTEAKEIQKRAKSDRAKERARIEVKRAEVALADVQAELGKANKELKIAKKARKAAVNAKMSELLPAELLEEEGVNYGGEMAVTSYEGEITLVPLVDIVRGNRGRRKETPRTEAATQVGNLAEFVVWGGEAMEPDENGNPVPIKVKGLYEREAMGFAGRLEAEVELSRQRLERQAGGEAKEVGDVNVEIGRALDQAGEGARKAVELVIKASGENEFGNISPENKKRLGEMIGSVTAEMVNQAASLGAEAIGGKTPEIQQKIGNWVGAVEMILDNAPAEAGNLAGLRQLVETLKRFAHSIE